MIMKNFYIFIITLLLLSVADQSQAAGEKIVKQVFPIGSSFSTGTNISLKSAIGQLSISESSSPSITVNGGFIFENLFCCVMRGDVQDPKDGKVLVNDLVFLVNYVFKGGPLPSCPEEGDVQPPLDGKILVNDLVYLVVDVFKGGPPPPAC